MTDYTTPEANRRAGKARSERRRKALPFSDHQHLGGPGGCPDHCLACERERIEIAQLMRTNAHKIGLEP
jgi:hypothetical protein